MNWRVANQTRRVAVQVDLANHRDFVLAKYGALSLDKVRRARVPAFVDAGKTYVVLPGRLAEQLGVRAHGNATVRYVDQHGAQRTVVDDLHVELFGRHGTFSAIVEPSRSDVLIGAIVLEALDLLVDCGTQTLQPRDPKQMITEIG